MKRIEKIAALSNQLHCQPRLKLKRDAIPEAWGSGIGLPVRTYIEIIGPWPFREVEWLEINPIVMEHIGRLVAPKQWNHLNTLVSLLQVENVEYSIVDGMIRIPIEAITN
ncbi:hypothetical protein KB206_13210 [Microvirga sp. STS02]|uniref:DUF6678 family protein n=1 Tax=Hymenobacter negativus TaxID=2795026 RepID=UPI0018DB523A|nr:MULTISPECIES: DUF6678 family protein [Bacteria]MBH8569845.1 hypothetical protein [Hymenobacter negativus]MBR7209584.1 hypothetical protein [Microvirga sp. STS02]